MDLHVGQRQLTADMGEKAGLLPNPLQQPKLTPRVRQGEDQPGQTGTRAQIRNPGAAEQPAQRQTLAQMPSHQLRRAGDGGQIVDLVPTLQQLHVAHQLIPLSIGKGRPQGRNQRRQRLVTHVSRRCPSAVCACPKRHRCLPGHRTPAYCEPSRRWCSGRLPESACPAEHRRLVCHS